MKSFCCIDPCTFFSTENNIIILDDKKNLFYFHPNNEMNITFNLPIGKYFTENSLQQKLFTPYEEFKKPERYISPKEFKIIVKKNPNKATISLRNRTITIDPKIANHKYRPCLQFILGHEIYHTTVGGNLYDTKGNLIFNAEAACDDFSKNYMLSHGFNPSQIKIACNLLLNDQTRKECIHHSTVEQKHRR